MAALPSGIKLFRLCFYIVDLKWDEISSILENEIYTHESRGIPVIAYNWILLYTHGQSYEKKRGGINRKNKPPYHIIATKKNRAIIKQWATQYANKTKIVLGEPDETHKPKKNRIR